MRRIRNYAERISPELQCKFNCACRHYQYYIQHLESAPKQQTNVELDCLKAALIADFVLPRLGVVLPLLIMTLPDDSGDR